MTTALTNQPNMHATPSRTSHQIDAHATNNVMAKRLLWIAIGLGVAYMALKEIPDGRRYLRLERM